MENHNLWAPWRINYLQQLDAAADPDDSQCFLCKAAEPGIDERSRTERLVLLHDDRGVLLLNRYPYANGHMLATPADHVSDLSSLSVAQRSGLMELSELGHRLLVTAMNVQGVNIGLNLGRCAGAGVPGHVHMHIVPRWHGDANFIQVVGQVRVIPQAMEASYDALVKALAELD